MRSGAATWRRGSLAGLVVIILAALTGLLSSPVAVRAETTSTTSTTSTTAAPAGDGAGAVVAGVEPRAADYTPVNPGLVAAQMGVQVWPEYDTTDVLVLIDLTLPPTTVFPYTFNFYVPKGARLTGIAEVDSNGQFVYKMAPPKVTPGTDMDQVTITVPSLPVLRLEYYYNPGLAATGQRSFDVLFRAPADAAQLSVGVQQPLRSTAFTVQPVLAQRTTDAEGFNYAFGTFPNIKQGDTLKLKVSYTKSDGEPSIQAGGSQGGSPEAGASSRYLVWLLVVLVVGVAVLVGFRLYQRRQPAPSTTRSLGGAARGSSGRVGGSTRRPARGARPPVAPGPGGLVRFCTQCGQRLTKKDRFCPQCGHERES